MTIHYDAAPVPVRDDIPAADRSCWQHIARPGAWWSGEQRVAIASEGRRARSCQLCQKRGEALTPSAVQDEHESDGKLPPAAIEAVHRIATDPARLTRSWYQSVLAQGLSDAQYVEIIGVVSSVVSIDSFCRALGAPLHPLPEPCSGEPSRRRPTRALDDRAWVPMVSHDQLDPEDRDLYGGDRTANVIRAMSLVPDEVRNLRQLLNAYYIPIGELPNVAIGRSISRSQIELLAGRVSALNECFY